MAADKFVSIKEAILQAVEGMGGDDIRKAPMYNVWATQAEKKIGSYYGLEKEICIIDIENCQAKLPCGTQEVLGLLMGDQGTDCDTNFDSICNMSIPTIDYTSLDTGIGLTIIGGGREVIKSARYEIRENNTIEFGFSPSDTKLTVKVLKHPVDSEGFIRVQEGHVMAIATYIKWKVAEQMQWGPNKMPMSSISYYMKEWARQCRDAIANSSWPSDTETEEISGIINNPMIANVYYLSDTIY